MKYLYRFLWSFCELLGISLGKYSPEVFARSLDKVYAKVKVKQRL